MDGTLVGTCPVARTGGWQTWTTNTCSVRGVTGKHNVYLKFTGGSGYLLNLNWFRFNSASVTPTTNPTSASTTTQIPPSTPTPTSIGGNFTLNYTISNDWGSGAGISMTIKNNSTSAINGWTLVFNFVFEVSIKSSFLIRQLTSYLFDDPLIINQGS